MPWLDSPHWCKDPALIALVTVSMAGVGAFISTLEWLVNRRQLASAGLLSFDVLGSRPLLVGQEVVPSVLRSLLAYRPYCGALVLRLLSLAALPVAFTLGQRFSAMLLLAIIVATGMLIQLRSPFGLDGSDQMTTQIYGALLVGMLVGGPDHMRLALWYIAAQSALSYFISGVAKLFSPTWRAGGVTQRVFNTRTYGSESAARALVARPAVGRVLDWVAIGAESLFPLCLVAGFPLIYVFLAWGVLFHLVNAVVMGLNSFFWAFVATYPALLFTAATLQMRIFQG